MIQDWFTIKMLGIWRVWKKISVLKMRHNCKRLWGGDKLEMYLRDEMMSSLETLGRKSMHREKPHNYPKRYFNFKDKPTKGSPFFK